MELNKKKIMGILYPIAIFAFIGFCYFALIVCTFYLNHHHMFGSAFNTAYSVITLIIFHVVFVCIIYCFVSAIVKNPGQPPKFWVN